MGNRCCKTTSFLYRSDVALHHAKILYTISKFVLKERNLGLLKAKKFDRYLVVSFSDRWLDLNAGKDIFFDVKLTKEGRLVLSAKLVEMDRTNEDVKVEL